MSRKEIAVEKQCISCKAIVNEANQECPECGEFLVYLNDERAEVPEEQVASTEGVEPEEPAEEE